MICDICGEERIDDGDGVLNCSCNMYSHDPGPTCEHCQTLMHTVVFETEEGCPSGGGYMCPNRCESQQMEDVDFDPVPPSPAPPTEGSPCWKCKHETSVVRNPLTKDGEYGNYCSDCGYSLRYHHIFGEGREFDFAVPGNKKRWYLHKKGRI